ncbi:ChrR family anti-sigma-E factor [Bowmanella sp. JS7-9]|uniref:ChrR family anti-sigma-E factor n=1 Tax=Pseudobowmanella zhangzhouensis TaxID=1537679 RepID=A0ABW1XK62_9ALTE|nr:ChrR family anti-sigma-E factor [Bowmanella sp. JS7-9]TBX27569.1 hypothetical protein TK45_00030 [Bowmanella sp. JS7-9]
MINFHPDPGLLRAFAAAQLPSGLNMLVAAHAEMCACCQQHIETFELALANESFSASDNTYDFADMAARIMAQGDAPAEPEVKSRILELNEAEAIQLPRALRHVGMGDWFTLGKMSRARIETGEDDIHCHLLKIDAGGEIPAHTHKGFEATLLLDGSFSDDMGKYQRGDFIWLDGNHTHSPVSTKGCVCLTAADDALHFTQGLSRLLNPLGRFLY